MWRGRPCPRPLLLLKLWGGYSCPRIPLSLPRTPRIHFLSFPHHAIQPRIRNPARPQQSTQKEPVEEPNQRPNGSKQQGDARQSQQTMKSVEQVSRGIHQQQEHSGYKNQGDQP